MHNECAKTQLEALDRAWKRWKDHPDGANFSHMARELSLLIVAVIENAQRGNVTLTFSAPLPLSKERTRITVHFLRNGQRIIEHHCFVRDFNDVVQDFQLHTLERYLRNPDFRITDPAFIRMGLALRAYSMERSMKREYLRRVESQANESEWEDRSIFPVDDGECYNEDLFLETLRDIWFHPFSFESNGRLVKYSSGLSLRYLYVTLRVHSDASLQDIGRELNIHPSNFTYLKKELKDILTTSSFKEWLPLGNFTPIKVSRQVREQLDIIGVHSRFGLIRQTMDEGIQRKILKRKKALWGVYSWARDHRKSSCCTEDQVSIRTLMNESQPSMEMEIRISKGEYALLKVKFL